MKRTFKLRLEGEEMTVTVERRGNELVVKRDSAEFTVTILPEKNTATFDTRHDSPTSPSTTRGATTAAASSPSPQPRPKPNTTQPEAAPAGAVPAPITGTIKEVLVNIGDSISQGDRVMMMEAMKMDIEIVAPSSGKLSGVFVKAGDSVKEHQALFSVE